MRKKSLTFSDEPSARETEGGKDHGKQRYFCGADPPGDPGIREVIGQGGGGSRTHAGAAERYPEQPALAAGGGAGADPDCNGMRKEEVENAQIQSSIRRREQKGCS